MSLVSFSARALEVEQTQMRRPPKQVADYTLSATFSSAALEKWVAQIRETLLTIEQYPNEPLELVAGSARIQLKTKSLLLRFAFRP